jgi:hypothetical protein
MTGNDEPLSDNTSDILAEESPVSVTFRPIRGTKISLSDREASREAGGKEPVPCRLSVILAREAPVGVIFRRGPSNLVELIKWNTDADAFERGQWFKGRIYDEYSDLTPDGSLLVYGAPKMWLGRNVDKDHFPVWTAVSRPPWLTALAL